MKRNCVLALRVVLLLSISATSFAEILPIEDFVKLPSARDVKLSPDGKYLSVISRDGDQEMLAVLDADSRAGVITFPVTSRFESIAYADWANSERLVYSISRTRGWVKEPGSWGELYGVNVDGKRHDVIFGANAAVKQTGTHIPQRKATRAYLRIVDRLPDDKRDILIVAYPYTGAISQVYKLNIYSGRLKQIVGLPSYSSTPYIDTQGKVRFTGSTDDNYKRQLFYRNEKEKKWDLFSFGDFPNDDIWPESFASGDQKAYFTASVDDGSRALYLVDLQDKSYEKVFHHARVDLSRIVQNFDKDKVVAVLTELGEPQYHYFDAEDRKTIVLRSLKKAFAGQDVDITSETDKGDKVIVRTYSDTKPNTYYLFNTETMKGSYLAAERTWIKPEMMAPTEAIEVKTRDGALIHGYLTRPLGTKENLPLVVMPHGGPHGVRDYWGFDWETQLLANRGYAVLTINFRGSGGFGQSFQTTGYGKWGTLIQDDITDATRAMIDQKIADPKRICIYGVSFGGYSALMGAAREPDLYQCAIGTSGVYDLPDMFKKSDISDYKQGRAYLSDVLGDEIEEQQRQSPAYNAAKIKANVLLIHGEEDLRAPIRQARTMMKAFDDVDKQYEWLELATDGHGYYDAESRTVVYSKILEFLNSNIGKQ